MKIVPGNGQAPAVSLAYDERPVMPSPQRCVDAGVFVVHVYGPDGWAELEVPLDVVTRDAAQNWHLMLPAFFQAHRIALTV